MKGDLFITIMLLLALPGFYIMGVCRGCESIQKEATEAGVAHYIVDPKTGATSFEWKKANP